MVASKNLIIDKKIINVTAKRQVTIPLKFYEQLQFGKEIECFLTHDAVVIRPLSTNDDSFTMEILKDLVAQGYNGDELINEFANQRKNIKKAIGIMIDEADNIAAGKQLSATTKDIFGEK
ncbi:MAG: AbrB/MazE/SpoVT family DNA-binding domain-containing protein [Defluviitaleaceae bacterium]|nr:AbrB/MazE/SpoVT family DNA-binding domain-containing protein [Defluviitaleaceae bacterium]